MDRIRLDLARLEHTGRALSVVRTEFEDATSNAHDLAGAVGHHGLAEAVSRFAESWDDRRADMVENIAALADAATGIAQAFGDLDTAYAAALDRPAPATSSARQARPQ